MYVLVTIEMTITQAITSMAILAGLTNRGARKASGANSVFFSSSRNVVSQGRKVSRREVQLHAFLASGRNRAETALRSSRTKNDATQSIYKPLIKRPVISNVRAISASVLWAPILNRTNGL
jgi:hypothetical protein